MRILFRCDNSYKIGSGHLIRCLNLAKKLRGEIHFICRSLEGNINSLIKENQFELHELPSLELEVEQVFDEIHEVTPLLKEIKPNIIIVDHYGLDINWETNAKEHCSKILIIDDLDRNHIQANILDQNYRKEAPPNYLKSKSQLFLGPKYCILAEQFQKITNPKIKNQPVKKIMVFFGGSDLAFQTLRMAKLTNFFPKEMTWEIVVGSQNQTLEEIKKITSMTANINLHININYMAKLMLEADLFIGAGGSTSWERAKVGLPSLCMSVADNQIDLAKNLHEQGASFYLGKHDQVSDQEIINITLHAINNKSFREKLSQRGLDLKVASQFEDLIYFLNN